MAGEKVPTNNICTVLPQPSWHTVHTGCEDRNCTQLGESLNSGFGRGTWWQKGCLLDVPEDAAGDTWWTEEVCFLQEPWFRIISCQGGMLWGALSDLSKRIEGHLSLVVCSWAIPPFCLASISEFVNITNTLSHGWLELIPPSCLCREKPRQQVWHICPAIANRNCSVNIQMVGRVTCCWIRVFYPHPQLFSMHGHTILFAPINSSTNRQKYRTMSNA